MDDPIRIVIADDHPLFREGVALTLANENGLAVVAQADNAEAAFNAASELLPDVLLLDINMPGLSGIEIARRISAVTPSVRIVMLTVSEDQEDLMSALKAGARGYILKGVSARELAKAVRGLQRVRFTSRLLWLAAFCLK